MPDSVTDLELAVAPVSDLGTRKPEQGIGLCLSGGGYRALIFHVGALIRLNETGYLSELKRVSGVSGDQSLPHCLAISGNNSIFTKARF